MGEGEMGGWGEFKPGTLNSNPLVFFSHELTPGPWLRMGEGEMGGCGEFELGALNSKPLVYFPHELTPVPSLLRKEGCLCENLHLYFPIHQLSVAVLIDLNAEFESGTFNFQLSTRN